MSRGLNFYKYYDHKQSVQRLAQSLTRNLQPDWIKQLNQSEFIQNSVPTSREKCVFKGDRIVQGVVVRCDLNGYSAWAREKSLHDRTELLDSFFSTVHSELVSAGGVYFRDEGDCIIIIFSKYFDDAFNYHKVGHFNNQIIRKTYGQDKLTAKAIISCGQIAIYQKYHEMKSNDWSAEGEPFVLTARVEQAIESKQCIYYFQKDYDQYFKSGEVWAKLGEKCFWSVNQTHFQIKGIGKVSGWEEFSIHEYISGGRISELTEIFD